MVQRGRRCWSFVVLLLVDGQLHQRRDVERKGMGWQELATGEQIIKREREWVKEKKG